MGDKLIRAIRDNVLREVRRHLTEEIVDCHYGHSVRSAKYRIKVI